MRFLIIAAEVAAIVIVAALIMRTSRVTPGRTPSGRPPRYRGRHRIVRTPVRVYLELRALSVIALLMPAPTYARKAA